MPAISKFRGIIVRLMKLPYRGWAIYANRGEQELFMDASTLTIISGSASRHFVEVVLEWAQIHDGDLKQALRGRPAAGAPRAVAQPV